MFYFIASAVLAHFLLKEKLRKMGILGCVLCVVGSTIIVLHAPSEHSISSVEEIWELATQPGELIYFDHHFIIYLLFLLLFLFAYCIDHRLCLLKHLGFLVQLFFYTQRQQ